MNYKCFGIGMLLALAVAGQPAQGHFQKLVPVPLFADADNKTVALEMAFTHPMQDGPVMAMGTPAQFGVLAGGKKTSLMDALQPITIHGKPAYRADFTVKGPGDHVFFIEPAPYWEPAEQKMIIHYTKVVVNAFGEEEGWDAMAGFPVEIEPLTRPYGLWTGNVFQGVARKNGKPVPFAEVEVEFLNEGAKIKPPAAPSSPRSSKPTPTACSPTPCPAQAGGPSRRSSTAARKSRTPRAGKSMWNWAR